VPDAELALQAAVDLTRTGDVWLFRGRSTADRAIQTLTNAPVNHVGMAVVLDDLPPLLWHAELGRSLTDLWTGTRQRGVQLHDLHDAVVVWSRRYGQRGWLRQLDRPVTLGMEDAVLTTVARLDGMPFPSTARLAGRWVGGRVPRWHRRRARTDGGPRHGGPPGALETVYCAEVVALTYEAMGLLPGGRRPSWYDPGRFWSGDDLELAPGYRLGGEIAVDVPPGAVPSDPAARRPADREETR
jgi:chloramphenicol 3-O-phosphotransferase